MQQDKRTVKTEKAIRDAFISLLRKKEIGKVTVNDICQTALISRNTFYGHYADKYLLVETLSKEFIGRILSDVALENAKSSYQNAINATAWMLFRYLDENRDMVRLLSRNDPQFWQVFSNEMRDFSLAFSGGSNRMRVFTVYSASAITGCYRDYFEERLPMPFAEFVQYIIEISTKANEFMME